jgi:hypothetical protein
MGDVSLVQVVHGIEEFSDHISRRRFTVRTKFYDTREQLSSGHP